MDTRKALSPGCSEEFESLHEAHSESKANEDDEDEAKTDPQNNVPRAKCLLVVVVVVVVGFISLVLLFRSFAKPCFFIMILLLLLLLYVVLMLPALALPTITTPTTFVLVVSILSFPFLYCLNPPHCLLSKTSLPRRCCVQNRKKKKRGSDPLKKGGGVREPRLVLVSSSTLWPTVILARKGSCRLAGEVSQGQGEGAWPPFGSVHIGYTG